MTSTTSIISSANDLLASHTALISRVRLAQQYHRHQLHTLSEPPQALLGLPLIPLPPSPVHSSPSPPSSPVLYPQSQQRPDLPLAKRARVARYANYVPEEETMRNDYSQRYVDGGEWPQNWVLGAELEHRFEEYPKQQRLLMLKKASVDNHSLSASYLPLSRLKCIHPYKFDVILLDPPFSSSFTWQTLQNLPIPALAADPSFVFMWVGSGAGEGLERGREVLAKWGYRRCEDVVWVKTNKTCNRGPGTDPPTTSLLTRTKQHCLIGIRGTVRRSTDSWFVHCNVDTDVIIWEGDPTDPTRKPPEIYSLIENFCLGTRRLEIFGRIRGSLRRGWVTVLGEGQGPDGDTGTGTIQLEGEGSVALWDKESWDARIKEIGGGGRCVVPMSSDIDALRPKSPFRGGPPGGNNGGGIGGGAGLMGGVVGRQSLGPGQSGMGGFGMGQNQMMAGGVGLIPGMAMGGDIGMGMGITPGGMMGVGMMGNGMLMPMQAPGQGMGMQGPGMGMTGPGVGMPGQGISMQMGFGNGLWDGNTLWDPNFGFDGGWRGWTYDSY